MSHSNSVTVLDHPLVQHKLTLLPRKETSTSEFRRLMRELSLLMAYEVTRGLPTETVAIETPLEATEAPLLSGKKLCFLSILRAGNGMLDGMLDLVPSARVAHIGLYREPESFVAVEYYFKTPSDLNERLVIVISPVIATANTATAAIVRLKERGAKDIRFVSLIAAPEGLERLRGLHPDVHIWTAAIDEELDKHGFIIPGLGDAGDRAYGTK